MVIPYICFNGDCENALNFYQAAFDGEIKMCQTYGEYVPEGLSQVPVNLKDWIMHAEVEICGSKFWFADEVQGTESGNMVKLTVTVPTKKQAENIFDVLSVDGVITLSPTVTFYCQFHAALTDKYGVCWNLVSEE